MGKKAILLIVDVSSSSAPVWLSELLAFMPLFLAAHYIQVLKCRQQCVLEIATKPGWISAIEDFIPSHLDLLQFAYDQGEQSYKPVGDAVAPLNFPLLNLVGSSQGEHLSSTSALLLSPSTLYCPEPLFACFLGKDLMLYFSLLVQLQ